MKQTSTDNVFVSSGPMREELVQMAVKFLSHATVRNSPVIHRRTFLEKRGLTKEEIDEAFHRVPDPPSNVTVGQSLTSNQDIQSEATTNVQQQVIVAKSPSQFYLMHAFMIVGLLGASCAGTAMLLKNFIFPRLKSWIQKVVLEEHDGSAKKSRPSLFEEVIAAAKSASTAAADAAKASMDMLNAENNERHYFDALVKCLNIQIAEMRSISNEIRKLEGTREAASSSYEKPEKYLQQASINGSNNTLWNRSVFDSKEPLSSLPSSTKVNANGTTNIGGLARPSSAPASMGPSIGKHPKSYMEIMAMIQRGETPPGIKEINDSPPNPNQPLPNPWMVPRTKPWEVAQPYNTVTHVQNLPSTSELSGDSLIPWWHRKNMGITGPTSGKKTNLYTY